MARRDHIADLCDDLWRPTSRILELVLACGTGDGNAMNADMFFDLEGEYDEDGNPLWCSDNDRVEERLREAERRGEVEGYRNGLVMMWRRKR
jgi:hypothetical protein